MTSSWQAFALGSAIFAALTAILGKFGVAQINSDLATLLRTGVILCLAAVVVSLRREWQPLGTLSTSGTISLCLSGVATGCSWLCYYRALQLGPASQVAPVDKLSVVLVVLFAALFLGEPLTFRVAAGAALITLGAVLMLI
jgi:transporter family protein